MSHRVFVLACMAVLFDSVLTHSAPLIGIRTSLSTFSYENSTYKNEAQQVGVYSYLGLGLSHSFEFAMDSFTRSQDLTDDLNQYDYTALYTYYPNLYYQLRLGVHLIDSSHDATDGGTTILIGLKRFTDNYWVLDLELSSTQYSNYGKNSIYPILLGGEADAIMNVHQMSPAIGKTFATYFYAESRFYLIQVGESPEMKDSTYLSFEQTLSWTYYPWSVAGAFWEGKQVFPVRHRGFTVMNSSEEILRGFSLSGSWTITPKSKVSLLCTHETVVEPLESNEVESTLYTAQWGYTF